MAKPFQVIAETIRSVHAVGIRRIEYRGLCKTVVLKNALLLRLCVRPKSRNRFLVNFIRLLPCINSKIFQNQLSMIASMPRELIAIFLWSTGMKKDFCLLFLF